MGIIDRSERLFSLCMKLRQVGRIQFGRIFGTEPSTSGRYKAMIDLLERCYIMRAELNAFAKILVEKSVCTESEFQKTLEDELACLFAEVSKAFPEIEFGDRSFTIKDTQAWTKRVHEENWPP